ncbi:uncharacterized protein BDW43DRAFT_294806 [Aspergillus alliaceus]|uniref:uncharacterized protein n=1 Tax=Petromyces alliaceus TaxID=209559 RepID=UPI0012A3D30E|nr:uncharacterized protein BDW43DRAFT_294806 [Aspergillus alliaceus]KAB8227180.1 hypothetical protein BDW43DRAFT_294806 [Aspergillus alliaceus]
MFSLFFTFSPVFWFCFSLPPISPPSYFFTARHIAWNLRRASPHPHSCLFFPRYRPWSEDRKDGWFEGC